MQQGLGPMLATTAKIGPTPRRHSLLTGGVVGCSLHLIPIQADFPKWSDSSTQTKGFPHLSFGEGWSIEQSSKFLYNFKSASKSTVPAFIEEAGPGGVVRLEVTIVRRLHKSQRLPQNNQALPLCSGCALQQQ